MAKFAVIYLVLFFVGIFSALFTGGITAFYIYQLIYFIYPENRWWFGDIPSIPYSYISVIVMILFLLKDYKNLSEKSPWLEQVVIKWLAALLILYYMTILYALAPEIHYDYTINLTKLLIIFLVAYKLIYSEAALNGCIWAYIIGCTYIGYVATITGRNSGDRVEGIGMVDGVEANDTASALVPAATLLMLFAWQGNFKVRVYSLIMGALTANGIILINSRGAFLGVVVSLGIFLLYMIFSKYQKKGQKLSAILLIVFGLTGAFIITDDGFWLRMSTLQDTEDGRSSGSNRILFWMATFDMLDDHPLGLGIHGYNILAPVYMDEQTRGSVVNRSVHSLWFQGLSEVGWLGLSVFLLMLITLFRISHKAKIYVLKKKEYNIYFKFIALECSLLGFLVAGTFINRFRAEILYWMILFLLLAVKIYYLNPKKLHEETYDNIKKD